MVLGIGDADRAAIKVEWPDGDADCLSAAAGEHVELTKSTEPCGGS